MLHVFMYMLMAIAHADAALENFRARDLRNGCREISIAIGYLVIATTTANSSYHALSPFCA